MPPIFNKGGVWTNVEDEILRASISKYGLNQWSRVSSLLARKTAKQAKARWMEWLNPNIKKIEWSREEDEKLLHLAKLMPTQWRTIAPLVGRTATQCIERYQKLLDDAEQEEQMGKTGTNLSLTGVGADASAPVGAQRRYKFGDMDTTPESKPARPDAIDMDEDEKEMLSEARARLANTQGKKSKRKDRERLLEQSRRLATLQKRRELKLAGINAKLGKRDRKTVDYNADIPYEHRPAPGFYDTTEEDLHNLKARDDFAQKVNRTSLLIKDAGDKDKGKKRYRDEATAAAAAEQSARARAQHLEELNRADQLSKRRKLVLPAPQVQEEEIEQIVKYGSRGDKMQKKYLDGDAATSNLVGEYSEKFMESTRTPQMAQDSVMQSVREIQATMEQTSLFEDRGEMGPPSRLNFSKLPPPSSAMRTPNPLAMRTPVPGAASQTPRRDVLGFNSGFSGSDPRSLIRQRFKSLPKPLNNFEILVPEEKPVEVHDEVELVPDRGELEAQLAKQQQEEEERELLARSQVLVKDLPRPIVANVSQLTNVPGSDEYAAVANEIQQELEKLIISDSIAYPVDGEASIDGGILPTLDDEIKKQALQAIEDEVQKNNDYTKKIDAFVVALDVPFTLPGLDEYSDEVKSALSEALTDVATQANQVEERLKKTMGGYSKRQEILSSKMEQAFKGLSDLVVERYREETLLQMETTALSSRLESLQEEVNFLADAERKGQELYQYYQTLRG